MMNYIYPTSEKYQYDQKFNRLTYSFQDLMNKPAAATNRMSGGSGMNDVTLTNFDATNRLAHFSIPAGLLLENTSYVNLATPTPDNMFTMSGGGGGGSNERNSKIKVQENVPVLSDEMFDRLFGLISYQSVSPNKTKKRRPI